MKKGNLTVEFVFIVTLWTFLMVQMLSLMQMSFVRQRILALVRFGALAGSSKGMPADHLRSLVMEYAAHLRLPAQAQLEWSYERFLDTPASHFYDLWESKAVVHWKNSGPFTETMVIEKEGEI